MVGVTLNFALSSIPGFFYYHISLVAVGIVALFELLMVWLPETPRSLLSRGYIREGGRENSEVVERLRVQGGVQGDKAGGDSIKVQQKAAMEKDAREKRSHSVLLCDGCCFHQAILWISCNHCICWADNICRCRHR